MPIPFIMPKFDMDQEKATILEWLKKEGDHIERDETVLVVETDKVSIEVPAPASGTLAGISANVDDVVPVTTVIAYVLAEGETMDQLPSQPAAAAAPAAGARAEPSSPAPAASAHRTVSATPVAERMAREHGVDLSKIAAAGERLTKADVESYLKQTLSQPTGRVTVPATPAARRVARELGVDLAAVAGSGPHGRVQAEDVRLQSVSRPVVAAPGERMAEIVPLTSIRRTIAERMQRSFQEAPHIALTVEVDMSEAEAARRCYNEQAVQSGRPKVTVTALLVKVAAWALVRNPYLNASLIGDAIHLWKDINIGVATAVPDGLIVPVIRNADRLSVSEIDSSLTDLAERARANRLRLEDVQDGTFTISNLGMFGISQFRAVINPPESAILAVGGIVRRPVVINDEDEVAVRPMMSLTLSADHRVVDGVIAARFLSDVVMGLESPSLLLF